MNKPSYKKELITNFYHLASAEELKNDKLILVTSLGIIIGTPASSNEEDLGKSALIKLTEQTYENYRSDYSIQTDRLDENDGSISLVDVVIKNSVANISLPFLNVFYDQIIGITIGYI